MSEENNGTPKNKWSRIFRKKWFFPALYLTLAAILLTTVIWYQNLDNQVKDSDDGQDVAEENADSPYDQDAETVADQQEVVKMPIENADQAEIVTKFFDYNADEEDQESALVHYNNRYYQSTGIDVASTDDEDMNVTAALSGTVKDVKEDPLLGNLVELSHENDVATYYASLDEVEAEEGDKVEQGDAIGTAGKNIFGKDNGEHVHFELRKDGEAMNPEEFFNQPVGKLDSATSDEDEADESNDADDSEATDEDNETDDNKSDESDKDKANDDKAEDDGDMEDSEQSGADENDDADDDDMEDSDLPGIEDNDSDQPGMGDEDKDEPDSDQESPDDEQPDNKGSEGLEDSNGATSKSSHDGKNA